MASIQRLNTQILLPRDPAAAMEAATQQYVLARASGLRNKIINGNFDRWQRGTSYSAFTNDNRYLADRWWNAAAGSSVAPSQQAFTAGQTAVPYGPKFFHRCTVSSVSGANNFVLLIQKIENIEQFSNQSFTFSFWAKADANRPIGLEIRKVYGTGGSSNDNAVGKSAFNLTTVWQQCILSVNIPSNSGKTIAGNNDALWVVFWLDAGSSYASQASIGQQSGGFDFAQVQVEPGLIATPFENRFLGLEIELCNRYFRKSFSYATTPAEGAGRVGALQTPIVVGGSSYSASFYERWYSPMRTTPAVSFFNPDSGGTAGQARTSDSKNCTSTGLNGNTSESMLQINAATPTNGVAGTIALVHYTADAEL